MISPLQCTIDEGDWHCSEFRPQGYNYYFASLQETVNGSFQYGHHYIPGAAASRARPLNKCKITSENLFNYILNSHGLELSVQRLLLFIVWLVLFTTYSALIHTLSQHLSLTFDLSTCANTQKPGPPLPPCSAPPTMPVCALPSPQIGDQILEVNGRSFLSVPHDEAVRVLKSSRHLMMTVKDVGRLPHARTVVGETKWIASSQIAESSANSSVGGWVFWFKSMFMLVLSSVEKAECRKKLSQIQL